MAIQRPCARGAVALLLLALFATPLARIAVAVADPHGCCPESAPAAESPAPCQYVAPLGCCAQVALPATPTGDDAQLELLGGALVAALPVVPPPSAPAVAPSRAGHGPPHGVHLRTTVLRL
jgi:hypothetical protein